MNREEVEEYLDFIAATVTPSIGPSEEVVTRLCGPRPAEGSLKEFEWGLEIEAHLRYRLATKMLEVREKYVDSVSKIFDGPEITE